MALTIQQAAEILGIPPTADKKAINEAYRRLAKHYHPDALVDKSESEKQAATKKFKQITAARKIMLNPSLAEPDINTVPNNSYGYTQPKQNQYYSNNYNNQHQNVDMPRTPRQQNTAYQAYDTQTPIRNTYSNTQNRPQQNRQQRTQTQTTVHAQQHPSTENPFQRTKYNRATSFKEDFGIEPDYEMEEEVFNFYKTESNKYYKEKKDLIRITSSHIMTVIGLVLFIMILFGFFPNIVLPFVGDITYQGDLALVIGFILFIIFKLCIYDTIISYYIPKKIKKINAIVRDGIVISIITIIIFYGSINMSLFVLYILFGILLIITGFVYQQYKSKPKEEKQPRVFGENN